MRIVRPAKLLAAFVVGALPTWVAVAERDIPPAFGPHINLTEADFAQTRSFSSSDRIVGTYYFYWYEISTKSHIVDDDGSDALTTHPATLEDFSYKSVRWHRQQLCDMESAGIDLALMVFWGAPSEHDPNAVLHWSYAGLKPLVAAREALLREGRKPPRIGLFYDTSTLQNNHWHYHADLTTDYGKRWFYATVRDFFSCMPPKHWACMDGKPIVLLYAPAFARKWDQGFIDYTKAEFAKQFAGRVPWIAPQDAWGVRGDATCAWGGALSFRNPGIGEIGPGYDHSAVPGRTPLVRDREGGKFYEESWIKFLRRPSQFVMIETWNEFHEGTDIAASREYGRKYIELTRTYADRFKRGWRPPPWPKDSFSGASEVFASADSPARKSGLIRLDAEDGKAMLQQKDGHACWLATPFSGGSAYVYFTVDESFKPECTMDATVEVEYFDASPGHLGIEFDGSDTNAAFNGAYTHSQSIALAGDKRWKIATFRLDAARFRNSQNAGADFRVVGMTQECVLAKVTLRRR